MWLIILIVLLIRLTGLGAGFWFDESAQFWIAWGQDHLSNSLARSGLSQALFLNQKYSLDPILFTTLLHYWSGISTSIIWLRMLPVIFSVVTVIIMYKILKLLQVNARLARIITVFCASSYLWAYYSLELRLYSLGLLMTTLVVYYFLKKDFVKLCLVSVIAIFSQYNLWLLFPPLLLMINNKKQTVILATILAASVTLLYWTHLRFQSVGFSVDYLTPYKLQNFPIWKMPVIAATQLADYVRYVLGINPWFLSAGAISQYSTIIIILMTIIVGIILITFCLSLPHWPPLSKRLLFFYSLFLAEIFLLSIMGKFPTGANRWNLFHTSILLTLLAIASNALFKKTIFWKKTIIIFWLILITNNFARNLVELPTSRKTDFTRPTIKYHELENSLH